jgi:hypothetical protein
MIKRQGAAELNVDADLDKTLIVPRDSVLARAPPPSAVGPKTGCQAASGPRSSSRQAHILLPEMHFELHMC